MAEILMDKLPGAYSQYFLKEGVVHALDQLAAVQPAAGVAAAAAAEQEGSGGAAEEATVAAAAGGRRAPGSRRSSGRPASRGADKDGGEDALAAAAAVASVAATRSAAGGATPAGDALRCAIGARARRFNARYFTDAKGKTVGEWGWARVGWGWLALTVCVGSSRGGSGRCPAVVVPPVW